MTAEEIIEQLFKLQGDTPPCVPYQSQVHTFAKNIRRILFPHFGDGELQNKAQLAQELKALSELACQALSRQGTDTQKRGKEVCSRLIDELPRIKKTLLADAQFILEGDPAARSLDEVIGAYLGFEAILFYRIAHFCWQQELHSFSRLIAEYSHKQTGIDIHPAAQIGEPFFIDHGTGLVIGETAVIGSEVKFYQGVTLGALSVDKSHAEKKRHPTIEDGVVIYANATILGGDTVVGAHSIIGGNVWITKSVAANSLVYHQSETMVVPRDGHIPSSMSSMLDNKA